MIPRSRHAQVIHMLDTTGTLSARAPQRAHSEPLRRRARWVAIVIGISLSIPMQVADGGSNHSFTPKDYIRSLLPPKEALCLIKLYGKESAFKTDAIGNLSSPSKSYVYGIPQLKNPLIKDMSAFNQIDYGMKYVHHRYTDACDAYSHWLKKGWH